VIPKPGAEVRVRVGEPLEVAARLDETRTEELRSLLERRLLAMHAELDAKTGFSDAEPLQAKVGAATLSS
jgi:hypothetical protein